MPQALKQHVKQMYFPLDPEGLLHSCRAAVVELRLERFCEFSEKFPFKNNMILFKCSLSVNAALKIEKPCFKE